MNSRLCIHVQATSGNHNVVVVEPGVKESLHPVECQAGD
jgi:hypothetical protein